MSSSKEEEEIFEVEKILGKKGNKFLVKWLGYPRDCATWEDKENLNCPELLKEFYQMKKEKHHKEEHREEHKDSIDLYYSDSTFDAEYEEESNESAIAELGLNPDALSMIKIKPRKRKVPKPVPNPSKEKPKDEPKDEPRNGSKLQYEDGDQIVGTFKKAGKMYYTIQHSNGTFDTATKEHLISFDKMLIEYLEERIQIE